MPTRKFYLGHISNSTINSLLFEKNRLSNVSILKGEHKSLIQFHNVPDEYDLQVIQENICFEKNTIIQWGMLSLDIPSSGLVFEQNRLFSLSFDSKGKLHYIFQKFVPSGNLESDFRTFYSFCSAYNLSLIHISQGIVR